MRILLDESLPRRLRGIFVGHDVVTVVEAGWSSVKNGQLLQSASLRFELFVTADQNLQYQRNLAALPLSVAILAARDNQLDSLRPPAVELLSLLATLAPRSLVRCGG